MLLLLLQVFAFFSSTRQQVWRLRKLAVPCSVQLAAGKSSDFGSGNARQDARVSGLLCSAPAACMHVSCRESGLIHNGDSIKHSSRHQLSLISET